LVSKFDAGSNRGGRRRHKRGRHQRCRRRYQAIRSMKLFRPASRRAAAEQDRRKRRQDIGTRASSFKAELHRADEFLPLTASAICG
jgi:hypothetical protein